MIRFIPERVAWRLSNDTSMRRKGHQVWFRVPARSFVSTLRSGVPEATLLGVRIFGGLVFSAWPPGITVSTGSRNREAG